MTYCGSETTWATVDDLYMRFGDEYVDKKAIRRIWDEGVQQYVADESDEGKLRVISLALCDAKNHLLQKLSCLYGDLALLDQYIFPAIKQWHIILTIQTLEMGGDCFGCACNASIDDYFKCGTICNPEGICLTSNETFYSVSEAIFCCERKGCGCCCQ